LSPNVLPLDIEIEEYNPMALAEIKAKYEDLEQSSESTIDQLKIELKDVHWYLCKYLTKFRCNHEKLI
jgi:hypothetical protein